MKCVLSYSGLVIGNDGSNYLLSEIIDKYNDAYKISRSVHYDEKEGILEITTGYDNYEIKFNEKQKIAFEGKATDSNTKQLQKLLADYENVELLRQVKEEIKDGVYPTDGRSYNVYAESLDKELFDTGANVVKKGLKAAWPFLLFGLSIPIWRTPSPFGFANWNEAAQLLFVFSLLGIDFAAITAILVRLCRRFAGDPSETYGRFWNSLKELKIVLMKKNDLKEHKKEVEEELKAESFIDFVQKEDAKDNAKAKEYKDQFLKEAHDVLNNINQLPDRMQSKYRMQLSDLLEKYQNRVNALFEKGEGEMVLGEANDVWQIFVEILPELNKINCDIISDLQAVNERKQFNAEIEEFQQALTGGYTDGWTDGYTDDLTSGGVAYQRKG